MNTGISKMKLRKKKRNFILLFFMLLSLGFILISQQHDKQLKYNYFVEKEIKPFEKIIVKALYLSPGDILIINGTTVPYNIKHKYMLYRDSKLVFTFEISNNQSLYWVNRAPNLNKFIIYFENLENTTLLIRVNLRVYHFYFKYIWLFPVGVLILMIVILLFSMKLIAYHYLYIMKKSTSISLITKKDEKKKSFYLAIISLFLISFYFRLSFSLDFIHNDEIGRGEISEWGYDPWGYVNTVEQILILLYNNDYSFESWFAVTNRGKPIFLQMIMAITYLTLKIFIPDINIIIASRFVIEFLSSLIPVLFFIIFKEKTSIKKSFLLSLITSLNPITLNYSISTYPDVSLVFFMLLCLYIFKKYLETLDKKFFILTGVILGFVSSSKSLLFAFYTVFLLAIFLCLHYIELSISTNNGLSNNKKIIFSKEVILTLIATLLAYLSTSLAFFFILWPTNWPLSLKMLLVGGVPKNTVDTFSTYLAIINIIVFQTTYIELTGFSLYMFFLFKELFSFLHKKQKILNGHFLLEKIMLIWFISTLLILLTPSIFFVQHYFVYLAVPFDFLVGLGYLYFYEELEKRIISIKKGLNIIFKQGLDILFFVIFIIQALLVQSVYPYYGLYINTAFTSDINETVNTFYFLEPTYGAVEISNYIRYHSLYNETIIITTGYPHVLKYLLPEYEIHQIFEYSWGSDEENIQIIEDFNKTYIYIIFTLYWRQRKTNPFNHPLFRFSEKYATMKYVITSKNGIWLATLYMINSTKLYRNKSNFLIYALTASVTDI